MKIRVRLLALLALGSFLLCTVGCLEEKDTLTIYPRGAGTIHLYQKFGEQLSGMITGFAEKGKEKEAVEASYYKDLAKWHGVTAWAPVKATIDDGRVLYEAIGYFDNIAALKKIDEENNESFVWTSAPGGGFKLVWSVNNSKKQKPLEDITDEDQRTMDNVTEMFKGLKVEHVVVLPGTVENCIGCAEHKDRSATSVVTGDDFIRMFAMMKNYRKRIASKEMTAAKANAEFSGKTEPLRLNLAITCASGNVSGEFEQFQKAYQTAKTNFAASGIAEKIRNSK